MIHHVSILTSATLGLCCLGGAMIASNSQPATQQCCAPIPDARTVVPASFQQPESPRRDNKMSKPAKPDFHVVVMSKYGFSDTVDILRGSMEQNNLMILYEINAQKMLRMVDVQTGGMKQILFFHPKYMKRIRQINPHATIEPPLKIAVMERPDGKVMIRYIKPTYLFGRYDGLDEIGDELEQVVITIVKSATN